jgi:hypothetical protein
MLLQDKVSLPDLFVSIEATKSNLKNGVESVPGVDELQVHRCYSPQPIFEDGRISDQSTFQPARQSRLDCDYCIVSGDIERQNPMYRILEFKTELLQPVQPSRKLREQRLRAEQ